MTAQRSSDVKVLFLAGKGRSGGTLLASLLGQLPGFFNVGELNRLWDWGLVNNHHCGCGLPFQECPTWNAIFSKMPTRRSPASGSVRDGADRPGASIRRPLAPNNWG
jgi:hypothetical protein